MSGPFFWIEGVWPGHLAIVCRPRGGDWLADDVQSWLRSGFHVIVSLLTPDEVAELGLDNEAALCGSSSIEFYAFPIPDRGVPESRQSTLRLIRELADHLWAGRRVGIHCRQGIGRSGSIAACVLVLSGEIPDRAFQRISEVRGCPVPETAEQREWVEAFATQLVAAASGPGS